MIRWPRYLVMLAPLLLITCVDGNGIQVEIVHTLIPDTTCKLSTAGDTLFSGSYDPVFRADYELFLLLRNNTMARDDAPQLSGQTNIRERANDVQVIGFEGCWQNMDPSSNPNSFGRYASGTALDCSTLTSKASLPVQSATVEEGSGQTIFQVNVLSTPHLQQLFGTAFNPPALRQIGRVAEDLNGDGDTLDTDEVTFKTDVTSPFVVATRAAAWGTFPASYTATVVVQVRAVLKKQSGPVFYSNWFAFPIDLCMGCTQSACGDLLQKPCAAATGTCGDGTPCALTSPACPGAVPSTCPLQLQGQVPSFTAACLPGQFLTATTCTDQACQ